MDQCSEGAIGMILARHAGAVLAHLATAYDKNLTEKVKKAFNSQTYETMLANWQGVVFGEGAWALGTRI